MNYMFERLRPQMENTGGFPKKIRRPGSHICVPFISMISNTEI